MLKEGLNTNNLDDLSGQRLRPSLLSDLWVLAK
ncbi:protoheme IX farnesyltransferase, partial [Acidithiobacillus ferriphilus]|nr:protoheme IX farnesyltransferase [Acidithiobacillus ferriphilus]MBU2846765.1 protoheme IX farnesyltransferase [Acidithiobacillus ferriphilus]